MEILISSFILVFSAAIAGMLQNSLFKKISVNYVALVVGIIVALIPQINFFVENFNSDIFMGIIVAPLLFFDGLHTRLHNVLRSWRMIIAFTVFMITMITIVAAFGLSWLLSFSLPLSFILAAISTPTDATATESVTYGLKLPQKVAYYLKNESLFNDASGIILLNMAADWYIHKELKISQAIGNFLLSAGGGIAFGLLCGLIIVFFRQWILRRNFRYLNNINMPIQVLYLLTPFIIYFLAEEISVSGIIAVVTAGLIHNVEFERSRLTDSTIVFNSTVLTDLISNIFNIVVFVVLGIIIVRTIEEDIPNIQTVEAIAAGVILYVVNVLIRYLYSVFLTPKSAHFKHKEGWVFALGGIHGAVTFALAYTLAEKTINPADFHLILVSEIVLILLSMIIPTILFKFMLEPGVTDSDSEKEINRVRIEMVKYALQELDEIYLPVRLRKQLTFDLKAQINKTSLKDFLREMKYTVKQHTLPPNEVEFRNEIYRYAFRLERNYLGSIAQQEQQYRRGFLKLYREILTAEVMYLQDQNDD